MIAVRWDSEKYRSSAVPAIPDHKPEIAYVEVLHELRLIVDQDAGAPEFMALRNKGEEHPIEETGRELRQLFSWKTTDDYTEGSVAR
ncbi:hypothetical protein BLJ79_19955 [Arthrobacter sp. UCD-GKA]|nr:hypothetical protein BLJ79_19955 [Arthrobacter sp. UCD-GKA]